MWLEREFVVVEFVPDGTKLVCLTRIGSQQVLKNATRRVRNVSIRDRNVLVFHLPKPQEDFGPSSMVGAYSMSNRALFLTLALV